jgi:cytochrome c oxidase subunit II
MYQEIAWRATVILVIAVAVLFAWVALRASQRSDYESIRARAARVRFIVFWGLVLLCTPIIVYSLADLPYPRRVSGGAQVITATGHQWRWELSKNQVVAGKPVEFHVNAGDVTHGFGIYDPQLRLVAQTQAMPGYTNVLRHTFKEPGAYKILCLEYCGLAHHTMMAELTVAASE